MKSIIYSNKKEWGAGGVRFLRAENPLQVVDSTCHRPSGSSRGVEKLPNRQIIYYQQFMAERAQNGASRLSVAPSPNASCSRCES